MIEMKTKTTKVVNCSSISVVYARWSVRLDFCPIFELNAAV